MNDLTSAKAKLERARFHVDDAGAIYKKFVARRFYTITKRQHPDGWHTFEVATLESWPIDFALAVGDAAHNLRATLDHIVFASAVKPLTPREERKLQFPFIADPDEFTRRSADMLPKIPTAAIDLIESYQPYHGAQRPACAFLAQLNTLDNWDKHRALAITYSRIKRSDFRAATNDALIARRVNFAGPLEVGTELTRFKLQNGATRADVQMQGKVVVVPTFGKGMPPISKAYPFMLFSLRRGTSLPRMSFLPLRSFNEIIDVDGIVVNAVPSPSRVKGGPGRFFRGLATKCPQLSRPRGRRGNATRSATGLPVAPLSWLYAVPAMSRCTHG